MQYIKYILIALGIIGGLAALWFITKKFSRIKKFFIEVWSELKKVSWPTREELISSTWIVVITTLILSVFLGAIDLVFSKILTLVVG